MSNFNWDNTWQGSKGELSPTTKILWEKLTSKVNVEGKQILELGSGSGIFCYLAMKEKAKSVTLLDNSAEAMKVARSLFDNNENVTFVEDNIFDFRPENKYDIVMSNGVIEHFKGEAFFDCLSAHRKASSGLVVIMCPASPHYNNIRVKYRRCRKLYGYQKPVSVEEMSFAFKKCGLKVKTIERFYPLYGINFESIWPFALPRAWQVEKKLREIGFYRLPNAMLKPFEKTLGGFLIAIGEVC